MKPWQESIKEQAQARQKSRDSVMNKSTRTIMIFSGLSFIVAVILVFIALHSLPNFKEIHGTVTMIEVLLVLEILIIFGLLFILFFIFINYLVPWIINRLKYTNLYMDMYYPYKRDSEIQKAYWNNKNTKDALISRMTNILYAIFIIVTISDFQFFHAKIDWRIIFVTFAVVIAILSAIDAFFKQRFLIQTKKKNEFSAPSRARLLYREAFDQVCNLIWAGLALLSLRIFDYVNNYCNKNISMRVNSLIEKIPSDNNFSNLTKAVINIQKTINSISLSGYFNFFELVFISIIGLFTIVYLIIPLFRLNSTRQAIIYLVITIVLGLIINYYQLIYSWGIGLPFILIGTILVSLALQKLTLSFKKE